MATINFKVAEVERVLATQTLEAIEIALEKDGGSTFRRFLRETLPQAEDAYREKKDTVRTHLGASLIGRECARDLWYTFRWATRREERTEWHDGVHTGPPCLKCRAVKTRFIRLLNRGHLEEARFVALLKMINIEVWQHDEQGNQFLVSLHGGHFGGSSDCVIKGIPECPTIPLLGEFKTYKDDRFIRLASEGVRVSNFEYYIQMQIYMGGLGLAGALFLAVNKDSDELYAELVPFNKELFEFQVDRARKIIFAIVPPPKISETPGWFKCKICDNRFICHKIPDNTARIPIPTASCRTCVSARVGTKGDWYCDNGFSRLFGKLSKENQIQGCHLYKAIEM